MRSHLTLALSFENCLLVHYLLTSGGHALQSSSSGAYTQPPLGIPICLAQQLEGLLAWVMKGYRGS